MCGEVERTPHGAGGSPAGKKKKMHEIVEVGGGVGEDVHHGIDGRCVCASFAGVGESGKWVRGGGR
jgi:hypothetical protein